MNVQFYCSSDGGQFNIKVDVEGAVAPGLWIIRGLTSELVGFLGSDGHVYALANKDELSLYKREL